MSKLDYNVEQIVTGQLLAHHVIYLMQRGALAIQAEHSLAQDGKAGPATRAAIDKIVNPPVEPGPPAIAPLGKGMFIRTLTKAGTVKQVVDQMKQCGLSWVAIQRIWQYPGDVAFKPYNTNTLPDYAEALRDSGHEVWLWGYPESAPNKHQEFVDELVGHAVKVNARGIIVDPEAPFIGKPDEAVMLMKLLRHAADTASLGLGMTSYGAPWFHPTFPWSAFLSADFGMPQIYDANDNLGEEYPANAVAAWKKVGFKHIVPASAAFNKGKEQMTELLARTPADSAVCWWDWYHCLQDSTRWDVVKAYSLGG